jgi:hypothetical protein
MIRSRRLRLSTGLVLLAIVASLHTTAFAQDAAAPAVAFLDGDAGRAAIVDETIEPYFSLLQPIEMAAKTGNPLEAKDLAAQRAECRKRYAAAVLDFTADEKAALTGMTGEVSAAWAAEYPLFSSTPWSFIKLADSFEAGFPHTRGRSIVFAPAVTEGFARSWKSDPKAAVAGAASLLVHEQSHVVQRLHPDVFAPLYTGVWGFVRAKDLASDAWLDKQHLGNPDGIDIGWAFPVKDGATTTLIQPLVVFSEGPEPRNMPNDMQMIAVTLEKKAGKLKPKEDAKGRPVFRPMPLQGYDSLFGGIDETFHPNEIFACVFAAMVARDHFHGGPLSRSSDLVGKDFAKLRPWCREHFAAKEPVGAK